MAKDILVMDSLSDQMAEAGARLVERLDDDNAEVKSAFWLFSSENNKWKLIIASPLVGSEGPRKFYMRVDAANKKADADEVIVSLHDIEAVNTNNQIVELLNSSVETGDSLSGIRFFRNTINGVFIEDAYIYRTS